MAGKIGKIDVFDDTVETWCAYKERLDQYFIVNDVAADKLVPALLSLIGAKTYSLLRDLTAPDLPSTKSYDNLCAVLEQHLAPKPLVIAERFRFHKRDQHEGEGVLEFIAQLRKLSTYCEFGASLSDTIRDRLVCGLRNEETQRELLSVRNLTLAKAQEIAVAMETAARDANELQKSASLPVNKIGSARETREQFQKTRGNSGQKTKSKQGQCFRCNKKGHDADSCFLKNAKCHRCGEIGHVKRACNAKNVNALDSENDEDSYYFGGLDAVDEINKVDDDIIWLHVEIEGKPLAMELDTGAKVSVISKKDYDQYFGSKLHKSNKRLKTYSGEKISPLGVAHVHVRYENQTELVDLYVVESGGPPLFGREWLQVFRLNPEDIKRMFRLDIVDIKMLNGHSATQPVSSDAVKRVEALREKYGDVFDAQLGTLKQLQASINLTEGAQPKFCKARPVAYALRPKVERELDRLVESGVLSPVDHSEWATPIVPIVKKDGSSVRICGDFKVTVNPVLEINK